jgi:O-antigen/teichoic acid export membrane protein
MIFGLLFAPLLPVLYSHFSRGQVASDNLKSSFQKVIRIVVLISIPLSFVLYAIAGPVSFVVFGQKWHGIEFVIAVMALAQGYAWVVGVNGELYRAIGKPSLETYVNLSTLLIYAIGYYVSIKQGFETFVWTRFFLVLIAIVNHIVFARLAIGFKAMPMIGIILVATAIGSAAIAMKYATNFLTHNPIFAGILVCAASAAFMGPVIYLLERHRSVKDILNLIKKRHE